MVDRRARRGPRNGVWNQPKPTQPQGVARVEALGKNDLSHPKGPVWDRIKSQIIQANHGLCHCCRHPGADGLDHDPVPLSECATHVPPIDPMDQRNLKPIHHRNPCPVCSAAATALAGEPRKIFCNALKGNGSTARVRQLIANRCGMPVGGVEPGKKKATTRGKSADPAQGERDWGV